MVDAGTRCDTSPHPHWSETAHSRSQGNTLTGTYARQVGQGPQLYRHGVVDCRLREIVSIGGVRCFTTSIPPLRPPLLKVVREPPGRPEIPHLRKISTVGPISLCFGESYRVFAGFLSGTEQNPDCKTVAVQEMESACRDRPSRHIQLGCIPGGWKVAGGAGFGSRFPGRCCQITS